MIQQLGAALARYLRRFIPDSFVFALVLTIVVGLLAWVLTPSSPKQS